jgi:hypothetical protein
MPLNLLRNPNTGMEKTKGLLMWSDLRRLTRWLKARSKIRVNGAAVMERAMGVAVVATPGVEEQLYPLMPIAETVDSVQVTRIKPGLLFAGTSWTVPVIGGASIFDLPAPVLTGWPKRIFLKTTWRPYIVPFYWTVNPGATRRPLDGFPGDIEVLSVEVVGTDAATPQAAGWTLAGDNNQVPARVRRTLPNPTFFGSFTAAVLDNGVHYERIGLHRDDYPSPPAGGWPVVYPPIGSAGGGRGHRALNAPFVNRSTTVSSSITDFFFNCTGSGISTAHFVV